MENRGGLCSLLLCGPSCRQGPNTGDTLRWPSTCCGVAQQASVPRLHGALTRCWLSRQCLVPAGHQVHWHQSEQGTQSPCPREPTVG